MALKLLRYALDYLGDAAGLAVAAALLHGVTATVAGVAAAAVIVAFPLWVVGLASDRLRGRGALTVSGERVTRRGCLYVALIFAPVVLSVPLVRIADALVPGFGASGFWNTAATAAITVAVGIALFSPIAYFTSHRQQRRGDRWAGGE